MQETLVVLFFIGMLGDAFTTFLGILGGLGIKIGNVNDLGAYAFALIVTSVITGLNIFTVDVFDRKEKIILPVWFVAVIVDFVTSLIGSFGFIQPGANVFFAYILVFFLTMFITISPAMLRYIIKRPIR
ncbi:MAG: hypothetical protein SGJ02_00430 [bacterium]|nr:hypothetical protein [bacterium]